MSRAHIDACLPVTTLKAFAFGDVRLILSGQGPYARLIQETSGDVLAELRCFKRSNIHGFAILREAEPNVDVTNVQLLAWGDRSLRLIDLHCVSSDAARPAVSLSATSAEYLAPDWVLAGCAPSTTNENNVAYLVTAHNAVLGLTVVNGTSSKYEKAIHIQQLVVGVKSILYSAEVIPISPSHFLIAAGTVFGEIIVWSCFLFNGEGSAADATSSIHHFFTGHEGSIFGVQISSRIANLHGDLSGRLLASCSDDRTIRVWDISNCEHASPNEPSPYSTDGFELRCTGFGSIKDNGELTSESCVASAFGHAARIWGVHFLPTQSQGHRQLNLVSRGEDAHCFVWDLSWQSSSSQKSEFRLTNICSLRNHNGKHVWSLDKYRTGSETIIYTGGADGGVKTFKLEIQKGGGVVCTNRTNQITATAEPANSENPKETAKVSMKAFAFVSPDCFLSSTTRGDVQIGWVESPNTIDRNIVRETLFFEEDLRAYSIIAGLPHHGVALVGNNRGTIRLYEHASKSIIRVAEAGQRPVALFALDYCPKTPSSAAKVSFVAAYGHLERADLFHVYVSEDTEPRVERASIDLPEGFGVTCASFLCNNEYLILGSRSGTLVVYRTAEIDSLKLLLKVIRIHSKEGVTQILPLSSLYGAADTHAKYFLSSGRDGCYRISELETQEDPECVSIHTINSSSTLGHNIEGAYIDRSTRNLMMYGFRGNDFVLWDESMQSEVARINCGGSHRHWAFQPSSERPGDALFIWAQSGFNGFHISSRATRLIRAGAHGREVKAMGSLPSIEGKGPLFVTGGEDTTLRIFTPTQHDAKGPWGGLECLRVLTAHDSGPQHIGWSKDGNFMFTSSASEDFLAWRIRSVPSLGLAAAVLGCYPKSHPGSELRITSFDVLDVEDKQADAGFLLCLAYSNSVIKVFHFSTTAHDGQFTLLASGTYTSNCLTEARFLQSQSSLHLITASTDGHFTLWNLTPVLEPFYTIAPTLRLRESLDPNSITPETIVCENRYQIHSNSIKSLDIARLSDTTALVIAGGDDNAVTLSLLKTDSRDTEMSGCTGTIAIPDAHTASTNAVKIIAQHTCDGDRTIQITFASSGNDNRIKIWQADVDMQTTQGIDAIHVRNVEDRYCPVSDISALDVVRDEQGGLKLLVGGVGMELFSVHLR
ncbi:hypothetical protein ARAM_003839 [Aspergillus rambellii]|uniref:Uncharacterized protein n=1 Tax=Aspergillus rambellii TaxID=308745 RepID=A0A0F8XSS5_9EURO|nr:hypothetical protein ARAM_003839 [Aspergillus rambellii]